jgi:RNA-directed DNA polymerase
MKRGNARGAKAAQEGGCVTNGTTQDQPAEVSRRAGIKQAGERRARWAWAEASVWTDRMLTALEDGVKGGVWFSLIDKVWSDRNLASAWAQTARNDGAAGVDHVTVAMFENRLDENLTKLARQLRTGTYRPQAARRHYIPKAGGGERPLGIPTVRDRVVQGALRHVLEPIFERDFAQHSYGFRPGRGCKDALRRVDELLRSGYTHVVDADLKSYFDTIPHAKLLDCVRRRVADGRVLGLIESFLTAGVMEDLTAWTPEAGAPQGAAISPLLSNIYLDELDHLMERLGHQMVRYADDFVVLCRSEPEARAALAAVQEWVVQAGLRLHPDKTRIVDAAGQDFEFLGYRFSRGRKYPRKKSEAKLKDALRAATRRRNGQCLQQIIGTVNRRLHGWFEYFKHSYKTTFPSVDGYVRGRLRSILRKRRKRKGRGRGADHQRWPNVFFAAQGLFSLTTAHALARQSARAANH